MKAQGLLFLHFDHDADEPLKKRIFPLASEQLLLFQQIRKSVWVEEFVEELRQKDAFIFMALTLVQKESFLAMRVIEEAVVVDDRHQRIPVILLSKIILEQVQDVPDLPELTLLLSLQVQLGDNVADQGKSLSEFLTAIC